MPTIVGHLLKNQWHGLANKLTMKAQYSTGKGIVPDYALTIEHLPSELTMALMTIEVKSQGMMNKHRGCL